MKTEAEIVARAGLETGTGTVVRVRLGIMTIHHQHIAVVFEM